MDLSIKFIHYTLVRASTPRLTYMHTYTRANFEFSTYRKIPSRIHPHMEYFPGRIPFFPGLRFGPVRGAPSRPQRSPRGSAPSPRNVPSTVVIFSFYTSSSRYWTEDRFTRNTLYTSRWSRESKRARKARLHINQLHHQLKFEALLLSCQLIEKFFCRHDLYYVAVFQRSKTYFLIDKPVKNLTKNNKIFTSGMPLGFNLGPNILYVIKVIKHSVLIFQKSLDDGHHYRDTFKSTVQAEDGE